jgi:hypothetical protein
MLSSRVASLVFLAALLPLPFAFACSGGSGGTGASSTGGAATGGSTTTAPGGDAGTASTYPAAATTTANTDPSCTVLGSGFYWEIGDASGATPIVSGTFAGDAGTAYTRTTEMKIASASKWLFGAYVVEQNAALLQQAANHTTPSDPGLVTAHQALTMGAGYVSFSYDLCAGHAAFDPTVTVDDCFHYVNNAQLTSADVGKFYYNGGHFQWFGDTVLGLGSKTSAELTTTYQGVLGSELSLGFASPDFAGGMSMSAADYAAFLRKVLSGGLAISQYLSYDPVCTLPASCPTAVYSPATPRAWHYAWAHWIEDDAARGDDGAFSSPGAFGFYPWIDRTITYYGVLARMDQTSPGAYIASVECGEDIRKAFFTGDVYASGAPAQ